MSSQIWYMRPEFFKDGIMGIRWLMKNNLLPTRATLSETHIHLIDVELDDLEEIFHYMQGENWSPHGEARELIEAKGLAHTSMSVGDIIVQGNKAFIVDNAGFKELPGGSSENGGNGRKNKKQLFELGDIVITPGIRELQIPINILNSMISRHSSGDFGNTLDEEDREQNIEAIKSGGRIMSVYYYTDLDAGRDIKIWIITEHDRSVTTILLPDEY